MNSRLASPLFALPGTALFALILVVPVVALIIKSASLGLTDGHTVLIQGRYWRLLGRAAYLAAGAAAVATVLALPGAFLLGRLRRLSRRPALAVLLVSPLLLPPMVYAFGWQRLLPTGISDELRCQWVMASWCWPIPALLIGSSWARHGRAAFDAAILDSSPGQAFGRIVLPLLARPVSLTVMILMALLIGEYSAPHACGLVVVATELLGWATQSIRPADALLPALPLVAVILIMLLAGGLCWHRWQDAESPGDAGTEPRRSRSPAILMLLVVGLTVAAPLAALTRDLGSWSTLVEAATTYRRELAATAGTVAVAGGLAMVMGVSLAMLPRRIWAAAAGAAVVFGVIPGALIGEAALVAYRDVPIVYNSWLLLVAGYVGRYGWIGILIAWLAGHGIGREVRDQARVDGAGHLQILLRLGCAANGLSLAAGAAIVAALALADVATASLLQVPGVGVISLILIEKFHRFEDGMLISLSLWLVMAAIPGAVLAWAALRARGH